jgi:probable F420-dependent oxidoreductase
MVTSQIRLATTVLNNDFRNPVMLAKEIATLDLLSDGRVDLGLGAGWLASDYTLSGIRSWDPPGQRVDRLEESIELLRGLLSHDEMTFNGMSYQVAGFASHPRPVQAVIPLMIGGSGRRILTLAARKADIISMVVNDPSNDISLHGLEERLGWINEAGGQVYQPILGLRVVTGALSSPGTSRKEFAERMASARGVSTDDLLNSPYSLIGDRIEIKDRIVELNERYGFSYFTLSEDFAWAIHSVIEDVNGAS